MRSEHESPEFVINDVDPEINISMGLDPDEERTPAYPLNDNFL